MRSGVFHRSSLAIASALSLAWCGFAVAQAPITVDFNDLVGEPEFCRSADPPLTIGLATFSGGGLVTGSNRAAGNTSTLYESNAPDRPCDPPQPFCYVQGCNDCQSTITLDFAEKVEYVSFDLYGTCSCSASYEVSDDLGHTQSYTLTYPAVERVLLPYSNIGQVKITRTTETSNGGWRISVDNFSFYKPAIEFDIAEGTEVRALTRRALPADSYPSPHQTVDGAITISGRLNAAPPNVGGRTIYLRVIDPADTAAYIPPAERVPNDNAEPLHAYPRLPQQVTTDAAGRFTATLNITDRHAGDNYRVEASVEPEIVSVPDYECADACFRSGTITAWKRIYVEHDRMFRAGAFLTSTVTPCTGSGCPATVTIAVDDARPIARARRLRLIHAPRFDGAGGPAFYSEDVDVIDVNRRANTVEISRPANAYYGPDTVSSAPIAYLADAVGMITGSDATDFYTANTANVDDLFDPSFVEYVWLADDPVPFVPFVERLAGVGAVNEQITLLARKWFHRYGDDNVQHLLGAAAAVAEPGQIVLGRTTSRINTNFAWIFLESVAAESPRRAELRFNGEVTAHELGHEWQVNPAGEGGHCTFRRYDNATRWCTMHGSYSDVGCHGTCPEFYDGIVGFHYEAGGTDSEYIHIRRAADPFPQF